MANLGSLQGILQSFTASNPGVEGAAIVTPDGLPLASVLPGKMDEERTAAMSAAMLSLGERIGKELTRGTIDRIFVQGDRGYAVLTSCGEEAMLLTLASAEVKQGVLFLEIKQLSSTITSAMKSSPSKSGF